MGRHRLAEGRIGVGQRRALARPMAAADEERRNAEPAAGEADDPGAKYDDRKRHAEEKDRDEGNDREPHHDVVLQRPPADPRYRLEDDGEHRGLEPEEGGLDDADMAEAGI